MIRRILPLLLVAAATAQAADPAARYVARQSARPAPARQVAATAVTTTTTTTTTAPAPVVNQRTVVREETTVTRQPLELPEDGTRLLETANVLPLALNDDFEFRKRKITVYDRQRRREVSRDPMARFEQDRIAYGAVSDEERNARQGHYYVFWWRSQRAANVTVRLEYRQANLGNYVQAREIDLSVPKKGTYETKFSITGDAYLDDGTITAWRAVIIEDNRIVATTQSFLWH